MIVAIPFPSLHESPLTAKLVVTLLSMSLFRKLINDYVSFLGVNEHFNCVEQFSHSNLQNSRLVS